ncbi:MAG: SDR family NAD(P)-dependent oxidoreductase [Chloroflexi bacterium]|nr:SDR family NAD(P)-dependent oxidoreductase [Chloroflexota bacterium]
MKNLKGRTAVVTGASKGIGVYIARALAKKGMNLVLAARSQSELEAVKAEVEGMGVKAIVVPTDVSDKAALRSLVDAAKSEFGAIDVLVNNAGIESIFRYHALEFEEIEAMLNVNLRAPMMLTWLVLPGMLERGEGHIVNISSMAGKVGPAFSEPYGATKAGLIGFTQSLRGSYRDAGVSASVISPGWVETGMYEEVERHGLKPSVLVGSSKPEKVSQAVVKAIEKDLGDVIVNPGPMRLLLGTNAMAPGLFEWVSKRMKISEVFRKLADMREKERSGAKEETKEEEEVVSG